MPDALKSETLYNPFTSSNTFSASEVFALNKPLIYSSDIALNSL